AFGHSPHPTTRCASRSRYPTNGTRSLIPAAWTNWNREPASTPTSRISHGLGRLDDLLQLSRIISTMIEVDRFMRLVHLPLGNTERLVRRAHRRHPVASCFDHTTTSPRSLCSNPITGSSSLLRIGPPQCPASVLSPRGFRRLCFSLAIRARVP